MFNRHVRNFLLGLGLATLAPLTVLADETVLAKEIHSTAVKVACAAPWHVCSASTQNHTNFNATTINPGSTIWFNANFKASNIPQTGATVTFKNQTITFRAGGVNYTLPVPDSVIRFSPLRTCSTTAFQGRRQVWITKMPLKGDDEIFLAGLSFLVPSGFGGVTNPVTWSGTFSVPEGSGMSAQWKWAAAVYTQFTDRYNQLQVKSGHQTSCNFNNGDHAGTPEGVNSVGTPWKQFVVGGGTGGGGSNWTGSFSSTVTVTPVCT